MFCRNCGAQIPDDSIFCAACGAQTYGEPVNDQQQNHYTPEQNAYNSEAENESIASDALRYGIMGLAFSQSVFLSILGIIFSSIAKKKAAEYYRRTGKYGAKAGVGRGLGIGGLALGIFATVFFTIYVIVIAALVAEGIM